MKTLTGGRLPFRLFWPPIMFLLLGLLTTAGASVTLTEVSEARARTRFETNVTETRTLISERLQIQISLLRSVAGLFAADGQITRAEFQRFVDRLNLLDNYPGVQGLGFSLRVAPLDVAAAVAAARADGAPSFRIWPDGARAEYHTILYLEPMDARNRAALGFDMYNEPTRREAMARARDTGQPAASGAVILVQEIDEAKQAGFLIYLPIYRDGRLPASTAERRDELIGFAYSPFRADDLFSGIFRNRPNPRIAFTIYDGSGRAPDAVIYRSVPDDASGYRPAFTARETIEVAGRPWTIEYHSLPAFDAVGDSYVVPLALGVGALLSLLVFLLALGQARARHAAEQAVQIRDSFLSVASHELKTPLTSLFGNAQLLQRRAARSDRFEPRERNNVATIVEQSRRLNRLIDDLLDHTRLQQGRLQIDLRPLDLAALVRRVAGEVAPMLSHHRLNLEIRAEPLHMLGDVTRLDQVLFNLINNAAKYSPAADEVVVCLEQRGTWAVARVSDRGIGIPRAALPELFGQFYRAPNAVNQQIAGMGIGLYVVKEIVERHGGHIDVESEEGQGSTFSVWLPLADPSLSPGADQPGPPPHQP